MKDIDDRLAEFSHDWLDEWGYDLTIISRTVVDRDDRYRDPVYEKTEHTVGGELSRSGSPAFEQRAEGFGDNIEAVAWIADTHEDTVSTGESFDDGASLLRDERTGEEYIVYDSYPERNGRLRLSLVER